MAIRRESVLVTAAGGAGSATGSATTTQVVQGIILAVHLDVSASAAATLDVTIDEAHQSPALPVLTVANLTADAWYYPRITVDSVDDGTDITGPADYQHVGDHLEVAVAQANAADTVTATIVWDDLR